MYHLLWFCVDMLSMGQNEASGSLYVDDGHSFNYQAKNEYLFTTFQFSNGILSSVTETSAYCPPAMVLLDDTVEKHPAYGR